DTKLKMIVCADNEGIYVVSAEDFSNKTHLYESIPVGYNTMLQADGFLYNLFMVDGVQRMVRLYGSGLLTQNEPLKGYTLNPEYNPPSYGYRMKRTDVTEEEMALILQAGDDTWDFLVVNTAHQIAQDIRRTGAYYPLNAADGVEELLNGVHGYVKEAATAESGDVWMLPYEVSCPLLIYNEKLQGECGVDFAKLESYESFIQTVVDLPKTGTPDYYIPYYLMTIDITNKYLGNYAISDKTSDFHKEVFRTYLDIMKQYDTRVNSGEVLFDMRSVAPNYPTADEKYANLLFTMERSEALNSDYDVYEEYDYLRAVEMPELVAGEEFKNQVEAWMIVVNPKSKNMEWTLQYVKEICKGVCADKTSFLLATNDFSSTPLWKQVHEIVADGEIYFEYPYDIISDEMYRYRFENQSYEDTVSEMERKMNMYLNE
ncbi:MAG: hypothetical protein IJY09_03985, partial [Lachnospiraceae bacterium]|nr:hypothetical protein [Lachnospiraceae bacterium]